MTDRNELERLLAAATEGPWRGYSEPDVGLPYSLFAGEVMQAGFVPLEPLTAVDIDLICFLRNNAQHYLSLMDGVEKLRASLGRQKQGWESVRELGLMPSTHDNNVLDLIDDCRQALGETHDN